jgi:transcriptional regulator with XRE-family HTH domain
MKKKAKLGRPSNEPGVREWNGRSLRLRRLSHQPPLSLQDVAEHLGVAPSTVSRWENGQNAPQREVVMQLAELLECSLRSFGKEPKLR